MCIKNNVQRLDETIALIKKRAPELLDKIVVLCQSQIVSCERTNEEYREILNKYPEIIMTHNGYECATEKNMLEFSSALRQHLPMPNESEFLWVLRKKMNMEKRK